MTTSRWVDLEGTANTRDPGGLPAAGGRVRPGVLLRSDNLQDLTAADLTTLAALPLASVVDLRTATEREGTGPGPLAGRVRHLELSLIPEHREVAPGAVLPDRWSDGATGAYLHYLADIPANVVTAVRTIARSGGATIVHCAAGKDRTGVIVAVALEAVGVPREAVVADYGMTNERIAGVYARLVGSPTYADDVARIGLEAHRVDPFTMQAVLDVLDERWGGAAAYLLKAGLDAGDLAALQAHLVES